MGSQAALRSGTNFLVCYLPSTVPLVDDTLRSHTTCQLPTPSLLPSPHFLMPLLKNPILIFGFEHTLHFLPCLFEFPPPPPQGYAVRNLVPKQQSCHSCSQRRCCGRYGCCCLQRLDRDAATLATWTALVAQGASAYGSLSPWASPGENLNGQDLGPDLRLPAREAASDFQSLWLLGWQVGSA